MKSKTLVEAFNIVPIPAMQKLYLLHLLLVSLFLICLLELDQVWEDPAVWTMSSYFAHLISELVKMLQFTHALMEVFQKGMNTNTMWEMLRLPGRLTPCTYLKVP